MQIIFSPEWRGDAATIIGLLNSLTSAVLMDFHHEERGDEKHFTGDAGQTDWAKRLQIIFSPEWRGDAATIIGLLNSLTSAVLM
ncbi:hypothetical protein CQA67_32740, partial [Klebsiella pneumoniae]